MPPGVTCPLAPCPHGWGLGYSLCHWGACHGLQLGSAAFVHSVLRVAPAPPDPSLFLHHGLRSEGSPKAPTDLPWTSCFYPHAELVSLSEFPWPFGDCRRGISRMLVPWPPPDLSSLGAGAVVHFCPPRPAPAPYHPSRAAAVSGDESAIAELPSVLLLSCLPQVSVWAAGQGPFSLA